MSTSWQGLVVIEVDGDRENVAAEPRRLAALGELAATGGMRGLYLRRIGAEHEDPEDPSTWGPRDSEIDWTDFDAGTLRDYQTGEEIRPATPREWYRSATAQRYGPGGTGAFKDADGRVLYVEGGPDSDWA